VDGNAFLGHHKSVSVKGKLYQEGQLWGSFKARRNSMGGHSVSSEARTRCSSGVKDFGEDVAVWLAATEMNAQLGQLK
jgi:hypothetical protein